MSCKTVVRYTLNIAVFTFIIHNLADSVVHIIAVGTTQFALDHHKYGFF